MCLTSLALAVSLASVHHVGGDYNETNPGLGIEVPTGQCSYVTAGAYYNSYKDTTYYIGGGLDLSLNDYVDVGVMGAVTHGYHKKHDFKYGNFIPIAGLTASIGFDSFNLKVLHIPAAVTGIQLRKGF